MIALGCDHGGYELKQEIIKYLEEKNSIQGFRMPQYRSSRLSDLCQNGRKGNSDRRM